MFSDGLLTDTLELSSATYSALRADLMLGFRAQRVLALERQARIARALQADERVHLDGLGEQTACVDPILYWSVIGEYGPDAWRDARTLRRIQERWPQTRMFCRARNLTLRVNGTRTDRTDRSPRSGKPRGGGA